VVTSGDNSEGDPDSEEQYQIEANTPVDQEQEGPQPPSATEVVDSSQQVAPPQNDAAQDETTQTEDQGEQVQEAVGPQPTQQEEQVAPQASEQEQDGPQASEQEQEPVGPEAPMPQSSPQAPTQPQPTQAPIAKTPPKAPTPPRPAQAPPEQHEQSTPVAMHAQTKQGAQEQQTQQAKQPLPQAMHAVATAEAQTQADAQNAHIAAETAKNAASVANKVAVHSVHITKHAKSALKDAREALHAARVDSKGLSGEQKESLKKAEAKLKEATKKATYGDVKNAKYVKAEVENKRLQKMESDMDKVKASRGAHNELDALLKAVDDLRKLLASKGGDADIDEALVEIEDDIKRMKAQSKSGHVDQTSIDEMKAELEHLRDQIEDLDNVQPQPTPIPSGLKPATKPAVALKPLDEQEDTQDAQEATPIESKGIDIDTAMPYGDLEPFGREDTAQELTEDSIRESDGMVDQLERAEVAEEKRAVFRALTRLRGAAITSFDGVARSQTGNIDEYNKVHQWRNTHPLHHLADEESDVSKWAFPDNAD
jgi:hypothetical protein